MSKTVVKSKCQHLFVNGKKKGTKCNKNCIGDFCKEHKKAKKEYQNNYREEQRKEEEDYPIREEIKKINKEINLDKLEKRQSIINYEYGTINRIQKDIKTEYYGILEFLGIPFDDTPKFKRHVESFNGNLNNYKQEQVELSNFYINKHNATLNDDEDPQLLCTCWEDIPYPEREYLLYLYNNRTDRSKIVKEFTGTKATAEILKKRLENKFRENEKERLKCVRIRNSLVKRIHTLKYDGEEDTLAN